MIEQRSFGSTGLKVPVLGFGAGEIGDGSLSESNVEYLLNQILDVGINLIDTARAYGLSEERIGRHLSRRRHEFVLATKVGYGIHGQEDWTYECVRTGIDEALRIMRTDFIDIVHLHSCPIDTLKNGEPLRALQEAVHDGKVRVPGYSGEKEALEWAVESGHFGSVEHSINICDQRSLETSLRREADKGLGIIAKRPIANAPWRFEECPKGDYCEEYWWRWKTMNIDPGGLEWQELALRFSAFTSGVCSSIVGTKNLTHLNENLKIIAKGPLPAHLYESIRSAFKRNDPGWWRGEV